MTLKARDFFILSLLLFFTPAFSQGKQQPLPLKQVLAEIESRHSVKFSYIVEEVEPLKLLPPPASLPLNEKLDYIYEKTSLNFLVSGNYITLYSTGKNKFICGYILDDTGTPIENATVKCFDSAETVVSDARGYFEFSLQATGDIEITHVAFEPLLLSTDDFTGKCRTIVLNMQVTMLEAVITERYLTSGIAKKKDGSFVIKPKKFGILPGLIEPDVLLTMQQLPGVNSIDETVSNINVRGGTHDQNLFLWNGIRLFQTGHFFGLISAFNPSLAHEIKIAKNGTSAFYGESVSSAVDISSRADDVEDGVTSVASNMINAEFYSKWKASEKSSIELSARRSFTDILEFPTYTKYSKRIFQNTVVTELNNSSDVNYKSDKEFYFYDLTGQYHYKIDDRNHIYADIITIKNHLDFTEGTVTSTNVVTRNSNLSQLTVGGTATWRTRWSDSHSSEVSIYGSYYNVDAHNAAIEYNQDIGQKNSIFDSGLRFSNSNSLSKLFNLYSGYQFNQVSIENKEEVNDPDITSLVKNVLRSHAAIGELEYTSENGKLFSRAGLRANYIEQLSEFYIEPRVQLNYDISWNLNLEILAEQKSQTVSQAVELQEDFLGIEKRRWVLANGEEGVPVQRSSQVSAGFTFRHNNWLLSIESFYKKVKGITTAGQAFQDQLEALSSTGSYTVYGTEFLIQRQYKGIYAWLSYSWNNNEYSFEGISPQVAPAKFPSNFELRHTISTALIYEWSSIKVALGYKWFTGRPYTPPISNEPVYNIPGYPEISYASPNSENLNDFFQANFSASYTWNLKGDTKLQLGFSVLNLFNRRNIISRYYRINTAGEDNTIEMVDTYAVERTPNALIKLTF